MSQAASSIVAVLARVNQRLVDLAGDLRHDPAVRSAAIAMAARRYDTGDRVEYYVDAELASGNAVGCWLELRHEDGSWIIESSIRRNSADGEDELIGLPERFAVDDDELVAELDGASAVLAEQARSIKLAGL